MEILLTNVFKRINLGYFYAASCVLSWSFIPIVSRLGQSQLDNFQLIFWSNLISLFSIFVIFVLFNGLSYQWMSLKSVFYSLFLGSLGCSIYYLFLYYGYANGNSIEVLIIQYSWPLQMIVLANFILRESLSISKLVTVITGLGGVYIIITKGELLNVQFSGMEVGISVLFGSFCFALFSVLSKISKVEILQFTVLLFLGGSIISSGALFLFSDVQFPDQKEWVPVCLNGIIINGISYLLWLLALKNIPATSAAVFIFFTPVLSAFWIVIFFDEVFYFSYILGGGVVIFSSLYCLKNANSF